MFEDIANTIKSWAKMSFLIGLIICEVIGIYIFADSAVTGILLCLGIPLILLGNSWLMYGFGQLIENTDTLSKALAPNYEETTPDTTKIRKISDSELKKIKTEYSNSKWENSIKNLSNEELQNRIGSEEWQYEYRALCKAELQSRQ